MPVKSFLARYKQTVEAKQGALSEWLWIARYHIVIVAMTAMVMFGWLLSGRYLIGLSLLVGLDWFLINLLNRITDVAEDSHNQVPGTARVAQNKTALTVLATVLLVSSFAVTYVVWPQLTPWRVAVQLIGMGYNYKIVPTLHGLPAAVLVSVMATNAVINRIKGYEQSRGRFDLQVWLRALWEARFALSIPLIILGGIYSGLFTPTEAAAMSAVWAFVTAVFIYKDMGLKDVPKVLLSSANMSAMLLYIITNAVLFSFLLTHENIPQEMADFMIGTGVGMIGFLIMANILMLIAGNFMEPSSIVLILAPILFPIAIKLGIDPVHFGIIMVVNMEVGMCHPPVGLNLYVASGITKMGITELTVAVWPWLLSMLVFLVLVTYWPAMSLWLPRTLGMM